MGHTVYKSGIDIPNAHILVDFGYLRRFMANGAHGRCRRDIHLEHKRTLRLLAFSILGNLELGTDSRHSMIVAAYVFYAMQVRKGDYLDSRWHKRDLVLVTCGIHGKYTHGNYVR